MELNFKNWLITEASRWKESDWTPLPADAMQRLKLYNKASYYCSFTFMQDKLGVNPMATFSGGDNSFNLTPYGIYAYSVPTVLKMGINSIPYANDRPYIWVFKAKNPAKIKKIKTHFDKNAQLWEKGKKQAHLLGMFHSYFLKRGVEGFVDEGTGTIDVNEPNQAVFFGSQTIEPVDVFKNTYAQSILKKKMGYTPSYKEIEDFGKAKVNSVPKYVDKEMIKRKSLEDEMRAIDGYLDRWDILKPEKLKLMARKQVLEKELNKIAG